MKVLKNSSFHDVYIIYYISTVLLKRIIIKYCIFTYCVHIHMQVYFLLLFLFFFMQSGN
jgi:hypothetical protein